jgi:hypothetical protein
LTPAEQLMARESLATIAVARPRDLDIIVLDNHHSGETGCRRAIPDAGSTAA